MKNFVGDFPKSKLLGCYQMFSATADDKPSDTGTCERFSKWIVCGIS